MNDERLVDIETKLAHQELLLEELNGVITVQQASIMRLEDLCRSLIDRVRDISDTLGDAGPGAEDERPPHY